MNKITPETIIESIYQVWIDRNKIEPQRHYLGASEIGHECDRWLWLSFRGIFRPDFSGRMLRLFNRGHREEPVIHGELQAIGFEVLAFGEDGGQFSIGGNTDWFQGHCDGIAKKDGEEYLIEIKTASNFSHKSLKKNGVKVQHPKHYAQMQVYMHRLNLDKCLYISVNKDTDELYIEIIELNESDSMFFEERAKSIISSSSMPAAQIEEKKCKYCDAKSYCSKNEGELWRTEPNCKNCLHFVYCNTLSNRLDDLRKRSGSIATVDLLACKDHIFLPELFASLRPENCEIGDNGESAEYFDSDYTLLFRNANNDKSLTSLDISKLDSTMLRGVAQREKEAGLTFRKEFDKVVFSQYPLAVLSFSGSTENGRAFFKGLKGKKVAPDVVNIDGKKYLHYGYCVVVVTGENIDIYETNQ